MIIEFSKVDVLWFFVCEICKLRCYNIKKRMYTEELKNKGFEFKIRKECEDGEGYDLYLTVSKGDSFFESFFSMSHSKGYYFTSDFGTDCGGDGCDI